MKFKFTLLIFLLLGCTIAASAQSLNNIEDIDVDNLTEQQIRQISEEARDRGLTPNQVAELAVQRGMPSSEAMQLRNRINQVRSSGQDGDTTNQNGRMRYIEPDTTRANFFDGFFGADSTRDSLLFYQSIELLKYQTRQDSIALERQKLRDRIFGYSLFSKETAPFEPSLNIPTPTNYQLAAGDQLIIDLYGAAQETFELTISPDGNVNIPNVGPIFVSGLTIEDAKERLRQELAANGYAGLRANNEGAQNISMQLSLGQIRSIKVSVIGEATQPGTYTYPRWPQFSMLCIQPEDQP